MFGERGRREPCGHRGNFLGRERNSAAWRRNHAVTVALRCYLGDCRQTESESKKRADRGRAGNHPMCASVPMRGGDRIRARLAAVHESVVGTFRTCRIALTMSVDEGKADLALGRIGSFRALGRPKRDKDGV